MVSLHETTGFNIFAKAEFLNPGGSIKDRPAMNMIIQAENEGLLHKGMTRIGSGGRSPWLQGYYSDA